MDGFPVVATKEVGIGSAVDVGGTIVVVKEAFVVGTAGTDDTLVPCAVLEGLLLELWLGTTDDEGLVDVALALVGPEEPPLGVSGVINGPIDPLSARDVVVKLVGVVDGPVKLLRTVTGTLEVLNVATLDGLDTGGCEAGDDPDGVETVRGGADFDGGIIAEDGGIDVPVTEGGTMEDEATAEDEAMEETDALAGSEPGAEDDAVLDGKTVPDVKVVAGSTTLVEGALGDACGTEELIARATDEIAT